MLALMIGANYKMDEHIKQDNAQAFKYLKMSCDLGVKGAEKSGFACFALADMYFYGRGVKKDNFIAKNYLAKSCEMGFEIACKNLGETELNSTKKECGFLSGLFYYVFLKILNVAIFLALGFGVAKIALLSAFKFGLTKENIGVFDNQKLAIFIIIVSILLSIFVPNALMKML